MKRPTKLIQLQIDVTVHLDVIIQSGSVAGCHIQFWHTRCFPCPSLCIATYISVFMQWTYSRTWRSDLLFKFWTLDNCIITCDCAGYLLVLQQFERDTNWLLNMYAECIVRLFFAFLRLLTTKNIPHRLFLVHSNCFSLFFCAKKWSCGRFKCIFSSFKRKNYFLMNEATQNKGMIINILCMIFSVAQ